MNSFPRTVWKLARIRTMVCVRCPSGINFYVLSCRMSPGEWLTMGGQFCDTGDCSVCRQSEWSLSRYLGPEKTNAVFKQRRYHSPLFSHSLSVHRCDVDWESWLTQDDVDGMVAAGLNSVRIPLGFWIIEDIVQESHEFYPSWFTFDNLKHKQVTDPTQKEG